MNKSERPSQHFMAFITYLVLVPLVYYVPDWVAGFLPESKLLNVLVAVGIIVPIISYIVMPMVRKCYAKMLSK